MSFNAATHLDMLSKGEILPSDVLADICRRIKDILLKEKNIVEVNSPINIVGDLHGQFYDLKELLSVGGSCPDTNYLFLGDYVDRGYHSVETVAYLFAMKITWPARITLLRGNHESRQITQVYGFFDECMQKFGSAVFWRECTEVFDMMPLAAYIIDAQVFGVHAGLSPSLEELDQIKDIDRNIEVPHEGTMCDLLWSDPEEDFTGWGLSQRGAGYVFGGDVVHQFNHKNSIKLICRSHQLVMEGYKEIFESQLTTVWSAPNYCYRCGNMASILTYEETQRNYIVYSEAPPSLRTTRSHENRVKIPDYFL